MRNDTTYNTREISRKEGNAQLNRSSVGSLGLSQYMSIKSFNNGFKATKFSNLQEDPIKRGKKNRSEKERSVKVDGGLVRNYAIRAEVVPQSLFVFSRFWACSYRIWDLPSPKREKRTEGKSCFDRILIHVSKCGTKFGRKGSFCTCLYFYFHLLKRRDEYVTISLPCEKLLPAEFLSALCHDICNRLTYHFPWTHKNIGNAFGNCGRSYVNKSTIGILLVIGHHCHHVSPHHRMFKILV